MSIKSVCKKILVLGLGLIGSSLAKALKEQGFQVVGYDAKAEVMADGLALGIIDKQVDDLSTAVAATDVIVLAVPVVATKTLFELIKPDLRPETILMDVGSTKASVVEDAKAVFGNIPANFVPAHPIAGSEKSGISACNPQLFQGSKLILTPVAETNPQSLELMESLWQLLGAEVIKMDVDRHDAVLAATSHLPHLLAFSLVDTLAREEENLEIFRYAAGGFKDFSRIAASDPSMWRDICTANKQQILIQLDEFFQGLGLLRQAIEEQDSEVLTDIFTRAQKARNYFSEILADKNL